MTIDARSLKRYTFRITFPGGHAVEITRESITKEIALEQAMKDAMDMCDVVTIPEDIGRIFPNN